MTTILIILHVLAAVLFIGPTTVAVSTFPARALKARSGDAGAADTARMMYNITTTYGMLSILVPLLGVAIMFTDPAYWTMGRFHAAIALAVIAWLVLLVGILPRQRRMMGALGMLDEDEFDPEKDVVADWDKGRSLLMALGGIFALLWVIMLVLMYLNF